MQEVVVHSPGRFNIIGEHTDHQGGLVLPACLEIGLTIYGKQTDIGEIRVYSEDLDENDVFNPENFDQSAGWKTYVRGVVSKFIKLTGIFPSVNIWITSDLPMNAGLSSSAAIEVGLLSLLNTLYSVNQDPMSVAKTGHDVENDYVGVKCGIMDQAIVSLGKAGKALLLDCQTLDYKYINIPDEVMFVIVDTQVRRSLSDSQYNMRISELEEAKELLNHELGKSILSLSASDTSNFSSLLSGKLLHRVRHVVSENNRVEEYAELIAEGKVQEAGKLLFKSHQSLKQDFEASWPLADEFVDHIKLNMADIVHGARMLGGGWGGSIILQLYSNDFEDFANHFNMWTQNNYSAVFPIVRAMPSVGVHKKEMSTIPEVIQSFLLR